MSVSCVGADDPGSPTQVDEYPGHPGHPGPAESAGPAESVDLAESVESARSAQPAPSSEGDWGSGGSAPVVSDPLVQRVLVEITELRSAMTGVLDLTAALRADFDEKIRYDEVKERHLAELHDELQAHRAGLHLRLLRPLFDDLIRMHDDLVGVLRAGGATSTLESLLDSVVETLSRNGVVSYTMPGDELDAARQRVIQVIATDDPDLDRRVARRLRDGFEYDGKVLRPEWVHGYRYVPVAADDTSPTS